MNWMFVILLGALISGCGSKPKVESLDASPREEGLVDMAEAPRKKEVAPQPLPPVTAPVTAATSTATLSELDQAIQRQDERNIAIVSRQMLIQNPQDFKALNALALYHYQRNELKAAEALLRKAISVNDQVSMLYSNLGIILQAANENVEAVKAYRSALKVDPNNPIAAANVGSYYAQMKDYVKANVALETAVSKGQRDWRTLNNFGVTLMAVKKYQTAETALKKATELQPQNTEVWLNYAVLLINYQGKPAEGLEVINRIRFIGPSPEVRKKISELENKAKSLK